MPYDGSSNYTLPSNTAAVSGATIQSTKFNSITADVESALNDLRYQNLNSTALIALATAFSAASASGPASLAFAEDTDNGSNSITVKAPASLSASVDVTLPTAAGAILGTGTETLSAALQSTSRYNISAALKGHIHGLTLSNNVSDATNDIDIAVGEAASTETNPVLMVLASALTKRLDAAWAVGTNQGGMDDGVAPTNTTYHVWLIQRSDTGVVDALFSTSATSPTMPTNYDRKRRIGAIIRASGAIRAFRHNGDAFSLVTEVTNANVSSTGVADALLEITVPNGIKVVPILKWIIYSNTGGDAYIEAGAGDAASSAYLLARTLTTSSEYITGLGVQYMMLTNTSKQIRWKVTYNSGALNNAIIATIGWLDYRGKDA